MSRILFFVALVACLVAATARAADDDPVKAKLAKAKLTYLNEFEKYDQDVAQHFEKREVAARKDGDKKHVDRIKADRKAYEEFGTLPKTAPATLKKRGDAAKAALETAYAEAVSSYTKTSKDNDAAAVEKELASFQAGLILRPHSDAAAGERFTLAATEIIDPKEWALPKREFVALTKDGHIRLAGENCRLATKHNDYTDVEFTVVLSASKGTLAYLGVGLDGKRAITSSIEDDGETIKTGLQSHNFAPGERGLGKKPVDYDEMFTYKVRATGAEYWFFLNGVRTSGCRYANDDSRFPGSLGIVVKKGSVTIKSIEIKSLK